MATVTTADDLHLDGCSALTGEPAKLVFAGSTGRVITKLLRARRRHNEAPTTEPNSFNAVGGDRHTR